jgi:hypothetical protein
VTPGNRTIEVWALNFALSSGDQGWSLLEKPAARQAELVGDPDRLLDRERPPAVLDPGHLGTVDADQLAHLFLTQPPHGTSDPEPVPYLSLVHF